MKSIGILVRRLSASVANNIAADNAVSIFDNCMRVKITKVLQAEKRKMSSRDKNEFDVFPSACNIHFFPQIQRILIRRNKAVDFKIISKHRCVFHGMKYTAVLADYLK